MIVVNNSNNLFLLFRYISKPEKESPDYIKASKALLAQAVEGKNARKLLQKYLIQSLPRDIPKQGKLIKLELV